MQRRHQTPECPQALTPILIIEDPPAGLVSCSRMLVQDGYELVCCSTPRQALEQLQRRTFACILCDVEETEGGESVIANEYPALSRQGTPILFVARDRSRATIEGAFQLGGYDILAKPIDIEALRRKLAIFAQLFEQNRRLDEQNGLLQAVLANIEEGVGVYRAHGEINFSNTFWDDLTGDLSTVEWYKIQSLYQAAQRSRPAMLALDLTTTGLSLHFTARRLDGRQVLVVVRDLTREKVERQRLVDRQESLEQFAHVVSHDLKAPLRHISGFVEILADELGTLDGQAAEAMDSIHAGVDRMRSLIDCLLAYSEAGRYVPAGDGVCVQHEVNLAWETLGKPGNLIARRLPTVYGDPVRLGQLFQNLLENAAKFARPDAPLQVEVVGRCTPGGLFVDVKDNGIGIPAEFQTRVFGIFTQLHRRDIYGGHGIGLSVCQRIMAQHDGTIEILSDGKTGTTFRLFFPRRPHERTSASA